MAPEQFFLDNLDEIERIVAFIGRRNHLGAADTEEFAAHVKLKLIEANYAVLRKFEGRSTFSTYMTTVVQRLYFQYRVQMWGKWRPSAEAKRLGDKGVTLERLLTRDGYTFSEVVSTLTTGANPAYTKEELERMYLRLPPRMPRPVLVSDAGVPDMVDPAGDATDNALSREREAKARVAAAALDNAIDALDEEDKIILSMRYMNGRRVPEIAAALHVDAKKLYKRIDRLQAGLRIKLEAGGISKEDIDDLILHGDEIRIKFTRGEKPETGPSNAADGGFGDGARPPVGMR